jgi:hypothetical protein
MEKHAQPSISSKFGIALYTFVIICVGAAHSFAQFGSAQSTPIIDDTLRIMVSAVNTSVDPQYLYEFEKTKYVPPTGKTLLIMGQTVEGINDYMQHFASQPMPGGWSAYWGIPEFSGIETAVTNETGSTQHHQMLIDSFPNSVLHSALWMVGKWDVAKNTAKGKYDDVVKQYAEWAKAVNRPIYLRIGYEFDGPHNALPPKQYVKAYIRIVDLLRKEGADNIAFVWHSYAAKPFNNEPLAAWYPGDDYVDWVGISVFGHAYSTDFGPYCNDVLQFAKHHQKPVMIAESSPVNGIQPDSNDVWGQWFVNFFSFIHNKNIKAVSFINENWTSLRIDGISEWKDARLSNNELVGKAWFLETSRDRYLKQSPGLFQQLGDAK